jgi:hypothetical protein
MLLLGKILVDANGVLHHNLEATRWIKVLSAVVLAKRDLYYFSRYFLDKCMFYLSLEIHIWILHYTSIHTYHASV